MSTQAAPLPAVTSCMTAIDTNVLIYSIDRHDAVKRAKARLLLRQLRLEPDGVIIPWQVIGEFLRYLRTLQDQKRIDRQELRAHLQCVSSSFPAGAPHCSDSRSGHLANEKAQPLALGQYAAWRVYGSERGQALHRGHGRPVIIDGIALINPFV